MSSKNSNEDNVEVAEATAVTVVPMSSALSDMDAPVPAIDNFDPKNEKLCVALRDRKTHV